LREFERVREVRIAIEEEEIPDGIPTNTTVPTPATFAGTRPTKSSYAWMAACLILVALIVLWETLHVRRTESQASPPPAALNSIAVLPLKNLTGDPEQEYFSDGLTESLITRLSKISDLRVISRGSVFTFKGRNADPIEVGKLLGVANVLEGSFRKSGETIRVDVHLVNTSNGEVIWSNDTSDRAQRDVIAVEDEIACNLAEGLRVKLCGVIPPAKYAKNVDAYQAYLKGRYFISQQTSPLGPEGALRRAVEYFQQAIAIDPNYAPAYAGLADCYTQLNWFVAEDPRTVIAKAKAAAERAVQLDDSLAESHTALATASLHDWDFAAAGREHERALVLGPGVAWEYHEYATFLAAVGRNDEAIASSRRAEELDPLNPTIIADGGAAFYSAGEYDEAIARFRRACQIDSTCNAGNDPENANIGLCYLRMGMKEQAIKNLEAEVAQKGRNAYSLMPLAVGYATLGRRAEAKRLLEEVKQISARSYVPKTFLAYIYYALGLKEEAFAMLERAYQEHDIMLLALTADRAEPLHSDPRFQDLLRRIGLT